MIRTKLRIEMIMRTPDCGQLSGQDEYNRPDCVNGAK